MPKNSTELTELIARRSPALALHVNEPLVTFLVVAREICGGDLDTTLVLLVIIQRSNRHPGFAHLDPSESARESSDELPSLCTNIRSISDSTGIPRETVRRKVQALARRGLVETNDRLIRFTPEGYRRLTPARDALVKLSARIYEAVDAEIAKEEPPAKA